MRTSQALARCVAGLVAASSLSQAQLSFELLNPTPSAQPGETIRFSGVLSNTGPDPLRIFGYGWYAPSGFVWDVKDLGTVGVLEPGESFTGDLFDVQIANAAAFETHDIWFYAGSTDVLTNENFYGSAHASVSVVPEPPAWLMGAIGPVAVLVRRRRRRSPVND